MDCVKNLTSCAGCTRKHARCHWRDVSREELGALDHLMESAYPASTYSPTHEMALVNGYTNGGSEAAHSDVGDDDSEDDDSNPLEDLEALGEKEEAAERLREDEEGLRNAKELSRQGFAQSVMGIETVNVAKPDETPQPPVEEPAALAFSADPEHEEMHHAYEDTAPHADAQGTATTPSIVNGTGQWEAEAGQPTPPINGGFRAVNENVTAPS